MFNGYETEELVQSHISALKRELDQQEAVGNKEAAAACREQLRIYGDAVKAPRQRAARRTRGPKPPQAASAPEPKPEQKPEPKKS